MRTAHHPNKCSTVSKLDMIQRSIAMLNREVPVPESEADTCRRLITPALLRAGWDSTTQIAQERPVTNGRVVVVGNRPRRRQPKRLDYLLRYTRDLPLAVVEAKAIDHPAATGLQQAIDYAQTLGLPFAYATNGREIIEHDFLTGVETTLMAFPTPEQLWSRYKLGASLSGDTEVIVTTPHYTDVARQPRYYQNLSINRAVEEFAKGGDRALLTLATGTGKSFIAFQICWVLWNAHWNREGVRRRPRILYLADRNILLDQPRLGVFAPFGDALHKIDAEVNTSRAVYFSTYQQLAEDEAQPGLYRRYARNFFDLIVVDECHRGSAGADSRWREILDYFTPAAKLGMTATPVHDSDRDTVRYFGNPLVQYSLAQGIEDGFLAPYKVRRVVMDLDALGWRPVRGQVDRFGSAIPDRFYVTQHFERQLVIPERTQAVAEYLTRYMVATDRFAKTIVFCVDQDHALAMRNALARANADLVQQYPDYVCRVTSDEGDFGRTHLENFQDVDTMTPAILTTSEMLTTGVDAPTVKNVVLARWVGSMVSFKQIIGRGTRLRTDYDKWFFTITDFTGVATVMFADPGFDGDPTQTTVEHIEDEPTLDEDSTDSTEPAVTDDERSAYAILIDAEDAARSALKYYVDGVPVTIVADVVYHLAPDGQRLSATSYTEYAGEQVRSLFRSQAELRAQWSDPKYRSEILAELAGRGIDVDELNEHAPQPGLDPFDLMCYLAFDYPPRMRRERVQTVLTRSAFWHSYGGVAQDVLRAILAQYAEHGPSELVVPDVLRVPAVAALGNVVELANAFGGPASLSAAVSSLQFHLYSA
jgi:type I restriction enzyme R subunit